MSLNQNRIRQNKPMSGVGYKWQILLALKRIHINTLNGSLL